MDSNLITEVLEKFKRCEIEYRAIHNNRKEIYRISKMLPESEGLNLMNIYDNSLKNLVEAAKKIYKY